MAERRWRSLFAGVLPSALAVVTMLTAACVLWEIQFAERFGHSAPTWIPLTSVYGARAHAAVKALQTDSAVDLRPAKLNSLEQLRLSPTNSYAWLRLAFVDVAENGEMSPKGVEYLQRSYDVAPYDSMIWRLKMAFETWPSLSPDLRAAVLDDLRVNWRTNRRKRLYSQLSSQVRNREGLAVLNATLLELRGEDEERWRQLELTTQTR